MARPVTPDLIRLQATELQRMTHADGREEDLAAEVTIFNDAAHDVAWDMDDADEPASFPRHLIAGRRRPGGGA